MQIIAPARQWKLLANEWLKTFHKLLLRILNAPNEMRHWEMQRRWRKYVYNIFTFRLLTWQWKITMIRLQSPCWCKCCNESMIRLPQDSRQLSNVCDVVAKRYQWFNWTLCSKCSVLWNTGSPRLFQNKQNHWVKLFLKKNFGKWNKMLYFIYFLNTNESSNDPSHCAIRFCKKTMKIDLSCNSSWARQRSKNLGCNPQASPEIFIKNFLFHLWGCIQMKFNQNCLKI